MHLQPSRICVSSSFFLVFPSSLPLQTSSSPRQKPSHPRNVHGDTVSTGSHLDKTISWYTTPAWLNDKDQNGQSNLPEDPIISPVGSGSSSSSNPNLTSDATNSIVTSHLLLVAISSLVSVIFAFLTLPLLMKSSRYVIPFFYVSNCFFRNVFLILYFTLCPLYLFFFLLLLFLNFFFQHLKFNLVKFILFTLNMTHSPSSSSFLHCGTSFCVRIVV